MDYDKRVVDFAKELKALMAKYNAKIGGCGCWTGFAEHDASSSSKCEPFIVTVSSVHRRLMAVKFSSNRLPRCVRDVPNALNSISR